MNFLNPFFLIGLVAMTIPVIIHLINLRRPKKVHFSTLSFFNELKKSTIKRIRFKQYLLMALRALALLFLALALARPFLPPTLSGNADSGDPNVIAVLIDNSASMKRIGSAGPLIDQAKDIANDVIEGGRSDDRFVVATTNGPSRTISLMGAARALETVGEIESSNTGNYTADGLQLLLQQVRQAPVEQAIIYLITDGQKSQLEDLASLKKEDISAGESVVFQMIELGDVEQQNLAVKDISLESQMLGKGAAIRMKVEVKNVGDAVAGNQFVSLEMEGRMAGEYQMTLNPGEVREFRFDVTAGEVGDLAGKVILEGDDITYDNTYYFVVRIPESRSVLLLNEHENRSSEFKSYLTPALEAAKQTNTQLELDEKQLSGVDQSEWSTYDVIIFDGLKEIPEYWFSDLQRFVQEGKGILFFPSEQGIIRNYNAFFDLYGAGSFTNVEGQYASFKTVGQLDALIEGHPILNELFDKEEDEKIQIELPDLFFHYRYEMPDNSGSFRILATKTGSPILSEQRFGDGKILISALGADPGWSNFPVNPLFGPLYYRSILYVASSERGGLEEHILGTPFEWDAEFTARSVELDIGSSNARPDIGSLPEGVRISYPGREWEPGILEVNTEEIQRKIAVNQDIMESEFVTLQDQQLENMLADKINVNDIIDVANLSEQRLQERLNTASFGKEIWNWFIWLALVLLIAETVASRLYKAETIS